MKGIVKSDKSYVTAITYNSDYYIPEAEHIERNDELMLVETDEIAAKDAERDGVKLIYNMNWVPDGVYIDTPENRATITKMLNKYPIYRVK